MMWPTLLLMNLVSWASGNDGFDGTDIMPRCSDSPGLTFTPVEGFTERYIVELCTKRNLVRKKWETTVDYYETRDYCNVSYPSNRLKSGRRHSSNSEWVSGTHNCSSEQTVCMSATFDFIFSACYSVISRFEDEPGPPNFLYFNITNPHTLEEFQNYTATAYPTFTKDSMILFLHTGVPHLLYEIKLCNETGISDEEQICKQVSNCSSTGVSTIQCFLNPSEGCHCLHFQHKAPWVYGVLGSKAALSFQFCRNTTEEPRVRGAGGAWGEGGAGWVWAAAGAAAALLAALLAVQVARRQCARRKNQLEALKKWLDARHGPAPVEPRPQFTGVLLLYAREPAAAQQAIEALKAALHHVIDEVHDIFSPSVMAACAASPHAWVRGMLRRRDVCVLLLQTPALQHLYAQPEQPQHQDKPERALLPRGAVRAPCFGDVLLQYALRLLAEDARARNNYNNYYIATLSELPIDVLDSVVRYRRYALPHAAALLLAELAARAAPLSPPAPPAPPACLSPPLAALLEVFTERLREFVEYATDNPNYLVDELMLIHTQ